MVNNDEILSIIELMKPTWDHNTDQIFIKDLNFRYVYVNPKFLEITGLTYDEVLNKTGFEIFSSPANSQNVKFDSADHQVIEEGRSIEYEAIFYLKGEKWNSRSIKSPVFNKKREVIGIYGISRNIELEIEMRSNLNEHYKLLEAIMETVPYPIFIKDLDNHYIRINKAYADIHETDREDIIGKNDIEIFGEEIGHFLIGKDNLVLSTGTRQFYLTTYNEKSFMVIKEAIRDYDGNITGILGIVNPFVDTSELHDRILGHKKIESLSALAGGIAHDLKNLLTLILGYSDLLSRRTTDEDNTSMAMSIKNASDRSVKLVERLLTFTKQTHGDWKKIDLRHIVEEAIMLSQANLPHFITIERNYSNSIQQIMADETQMSQLILNLLVNAIEAIKEKHSKNNITTDESIRVLVDQVNLSEIYEQGYILQPADFRPGQYILLQVSDTGLGISSDDLGKIFDPFYTTKDHGTGLGLSVIYGVTSTHHGLIKLTSDIGIGTTFSIYLPLNTGVD